jgi:hypothetical protein
MMKRPKPILMRDLKRIPLGRLITLQLVDGQKFMGTVEIVFGNYEKIKLFGESRIFKADEIRLFVERSEEDFVRYKNQWRSVGKTWVGAKVVPLEEGAQK